MTKLKDKICCHNYLSEKLFICTQLLNDALQTYQIGQHFVVCHVFQPTNQRILLVFIICLLFARNVQWLMHESV